MNKFAPVSLRGRSGGVGQSFLAAPVSHAGNSGSAGGICTASYITSVGTVLAGVGALEPMEFLTVHVVQL